MDAIEQYVADLITNALHKQVPALSPADDAKVAKAVQDFVKTCATNALILEGVLAGIVGRPCPALLTRQYTGRVAAQSIRDKSRNAGSGDSGPGQFRSSAVGYDLLAIPEEHPHLLALGDKLFLMSTAHNVVEWTAEFARVLAVAEREQGLVISEEGRSRKFMLREVGTLADGRLYWDFTRVLEDEDVLGHYLVVRHGIDATCWLADEIDDDNTISLIVAGSRC